MEQFRPYFFSNAGIIGNEKIQSLALYQNFPRSPMISATERYGLHKKKKKWEEDFQPKPGS